MQFRVWLRARIDLRNTMVRLLRKGHSLATIQGLLREQGRRRR